MLAHYGSIDAIPDSADDWAVTIRGAKGLADSLAERRDEAALYRTLAILRTDGDIDCDLDSVAWRGARRAELTDLAAEIHMPEVVDQITRWRD